MKNILIIILLAIGNSAFAKETADNVQRTEHYLSIKSTAPSMINQRVKLYIREVVPLDRKIKTSKTVLFIHGSGDPAEVVFDTPYEDYSWMAYLAKNKINTYALDLTGYGRSTRPKEMNNPCNLSKAEQQQLIPSVLTTTCESNHDQLLTTQESDFNDIDAAVNFILKKENITSIALIGWSLAGVRTLGYVLRHPEKVSHLILLAPPYGRNLPLINSKNPGQDHLMYGLNYSEFINDWDKQIKCENQVNPYVREVVWAEMLMSDSLGKTWATGIRRRPAQKWDWGFNQSTAAKIKIPTLLISGQYDSQVSPSTVTNLYEDLGSDKKVFIDLACSSHNAIWEKNHILLFESSLNWLKNPSIQNLTHDLIKIGY